VNGTPVGDFNAALAAQQRGDLRAAVRLYHAVLQRDPSHFEASNKLGVLLIHLERYEEAVAVLYRAVERRPSSAEALNGLALALRMLDRPAEALLHAQRAVAIRPDYAEALTNLGFAQLGLKRYDVALANIKRAIVLKPDFAMAYSDLGQTLQALGRLDEARAAYENAIARAPRQPALFKLLGELKRYAADDPQLAAMEELARDLDALSPQQRLVLHFALGKAYGNLGRHDQSFDHLLEGNRLKRQQIVYDEPNFLGWLERVRAAISAELLQSRAGAGYPGTAPVFIVGMPRSGSTLIEQILASHPMVSARGELEDLNRLVWGLAAPSGAPERFPEVIPLLSDERLRALGRDYCAAVGAGDSGMTRVVDKMPGNFVFVGLISLALPNARILHTRRDPVDTCLSCFSTLFAGSSNLHTYNLGELGRYYRVYATLMAHWRTVLPPEMFLEVKYEDVVEDLEGEARRVIAHCGLPWNRACLEFHRTQRRIHTASFAQVRQPLYRSSLARSQPYLHRLGPLLEALGDVRATITGPLPS